jgi:hypothetical protein
MWMHIEYETMVDDEKDWNECKAVVYVVDP